MERGYKSLQYWIRFGAVGYARSFNGGNGARLRIWGLEGSRLRSGSFWGLRPA